jgi:hypothetical protein
VDNQMSQGSGSSSSSTGTRDVTYDITAVLYHALQGVENCQTYMGDVQGKEEHRRFFQQAIESQRQLAEQAKRLLHDCLMQETGASGSMGMQQGMDQQQGMDTQSHSFSEARDDDSAFRFASSQTEGGSDQFEGGSQDQRYSERSTSGGSSSSF